MKLKKLRSLIVLRVELGLKILSREMMFHSR